MYIPHKPYLPFIFKPFFSIRQKVKACQCANWQRVQADTKGQTNIAAQRSVRQAETCLPAQRAHRDGVELFSPAQLEWRARELAGLAGFS